MPLDGRQKCQLEINVMDEDVGKDDVCASGIINAEHCGMFQPGQNNYKMWLYDNQKEKKERAG